MDELDTRLQRALKWIAEHGNLLDAPFPDSDIADIFRAITTRDLIFIRKNKCKLTEHGWRALSSN